MHGGFRTAASGPVGRGAAGRVRGVDEQARAAREGAVVSGETETGMKLKVDTFLPAADDPMLEKLDAYRARGHYPAVDYHRVTADNTEGQVAGPGREVTFAKDANAIAAGQGVETRFTCDVLRFEWVPLKGMEQAPCRAPGQALRRTGRPSRTASRLDRSRSTT